MLHPSPGLWIRSSLIAGLAAAVVVEAYLMVVGMAPWPGTYQYIASGAVGQAAYLSPAYAWLGVVLHLAISSGWALLFGLAAGRLPGLLERPLLGGALYGFLVFLAMQALVYTRGIWAPLSPAELVHYVVDHVLFFGVPLALTYRFVYRRAEPGTRALAAAA